MPLPLNEPTDPLSFCLSSLVFFSVAQERETNARGKLKVFWLGRGQGRVDEGVERIAAQCLARLEALAKRARGGQVVRGED